MPGRDRGDGRDGSRADRRARRRERELVRALRKRSAGGRRLERDMGPDRPERWQQRLQTQRRAPLPGGARTCHVRRRGVQLGDARAAARQRRLLRVCVQLRRDDPLGAVRQHRRARPHHPVRGRTEDVRQQSDLADESLTGRPRRSLAGRDDAQLLPQVPGWSIQSEHVHRARPQQPRHPRSTASRI